MTTRSVTILGAGAMGSALATPFRARDWDVRLWGTWLDDHLIEACRAGQPHPRTGVPVPDGTKLFDAAELSSALDGAELAVLAVASVGVEEVVRRSAGALGDVAALLVTSKGFAVDPDGRVGLLPDAVRRVITARGSRVPPVIAVGGPCKANEVAAGRPTATVFGCTNPGLGRSIAASVATDAYRAEVTADEAGVEICAPMKNIYAIALGIADGLAEGGDQPWHDLKAATFARAVRELTLLTAIVGGEPATAMGLAGVGDLEVTGLSGRNKLYGARIGRGETAGDALAAMVAAEQTVEGVAACELACTLVRQNAPTLWPELPLLRAVATILDGAAHPAGLVTDAVLPAA